MPQASTAQGGPCCTAAHSLLATSAAGAVQHIKFKDKLLYSTHSEEDAWEQRHRGWREVQSMPVVCTAVLLTGHS